MEGDDCGESGDDFDWIWGIETRSVLSYEHTFIRPKSVQTILVLVEITTYTKAFKSAHDVGCIFSYKFLMCAWPQATQEPCK